jgi:hypothetical protein
MLIVVGMSSKPWAQYTDEEIVSALRSLAADGAIPSATTLGSSGYAGLAVTMSRRGKGWREWAVACGLRAASDKPADAWIARFWAKVDRGSESECWPWTGAKTRGGYGHMLRRGRHERAPRLSYELHHGAPDGVVQHKCDNPACVNPAHLELGTMLSNHEDMVAKGRGVKKLRRKDAADIRRLFAGGESVSSIAGRYGLTAEMVGQVVRGRAWRKAPGPLAATTRR